MKNDNEIFLSDIWPKSEEIESVIKSSLSSDMFTSRYKEIYIGDKNWASIKTTDDNTYKWNDISTYIKHPPFFTNNSNNTKEDINDARILALLGDTVTTDHISPAGAIKEESPAGDYLSMSGMLTQLGDDTSIYIIAANGSIKAKSSSGFFRGTSGLEPGDTIVVSLPPIG